MNEADTKVKQQIVDKIKSSTNILVTVSNDPSVDELSAMLGLAAALNKIGKHATAIFSGAIPPAIDFLEPGKVFENTADSLRDFIIALDKEKADHLRYKVEGDFVKIFVTPYRTTITSNDLEFSQGDYNVELVLALGVANKEHLDTALTAHGQVLQDVVVATFSAGEQISQLGSMDWHDKTASSLSEMVTNLCDSIKTDKILLDKQIATSLLTGIVAATDRFSNTSTTSGAMTTAAKLMAAGADQQLIAAKLQESHEINELSTVPENISTETPVLTIEKSLPVEPVYEHPESTLPPDNFTISHEPESVVDTNLDTTVASSLPQPEAIVDYSNSTLAPAYLPEAPALDVVSAMPETTAIEPSLGGTLSATADQAAEDARRELESQQNKTILSHSYLGAPESTIAPINGSNQREDTKLVDIFSGDQTPGVTQSPYSDTVLPRTTGIDNVIEPIGVPQMVIQPPIFDLPLPPPLPDFSTLPPPISGFDVNPVVPETIQQPISPITDPTQFRIPGQ